MEEKLLSKNYVLTTLSAGFFYTAAFMLSTVSARYALEMGASRAVSGAIAGIFTFSSFFTRPLWGMSADRRGRKFVYMSGRGVCIAGCAAAYMAHSVLILLVSRRLFGIGYSAVTTAGGAMVCDEAPPGKLAKAIALYGATGVAAQAAAPALSLRLFDVGYFMVAGVSGRMIGAAMASVAAVKYSRQTKSSEKKLRLYEKSALPRAAVILFFAASVSGIYAFIPIYSRENNMGSRGVFFMVSSAALLALRLANGAVCRFLGEKTAFAAGAVLLAASFLTLAFGKSTVFFYISSVMYGAGGGIVHPVVNTRAVSNASPSRRALATATFMMGQDLGGGLGSLALGYVSGRMGFFAMYIAAAVFTAVMAVLYFRLFDAREKNVK